MWSYDDLTLLRDYLIQVRRLEHAFQLEGSLSFLKESTQEVVHYRQELQALLQQREAALVERNLTFSITRKHEEATVRVTSYQELKNENLSDTLYWPTYFESLAHYEQWLTDEVDSAAQLPD